MEDVLDVAAMASVAVVLDPWVALGTIAQSPTVCTGRASFRFASGSVCSDPVDRAVEDRKTGDRAMIGRVGRLMGVVALVAVAV